MEGRVRSRWRFYASLSVLLFAALATWAAATTEWSERAAMVGNNPVEANEQAYITLCLIAIAGLDLLAAVVFLLGRWSPTWWAVLATQVGIFAFAVIQVNTDRGDIGWSEFAFFPLLTLIALIACRFATVELQTTRPAASPTRLA